MLNSLINSPSHEEDCGMWTEYGNLQIELHLESYEVFTRSRSKTSKA